MERKVYINPDADALEYTIGEIKRRIRKSVNGLFVSARDALKNLTVSDTPETDNEKTDLPFPG